ncbi:biopolymer transport protein TolR [Nitrosomonas sp. Nm51]|uniref:protein TolR n=1 Tax=Nitrosomonas sp. Nm51 TaxID=133720 RepID=UPI0008BFE3E0|nr:protein TolR [Nitrosomonas sp. Nm51]SER15410.1 biopolymer transport protein TolR [Nitrosomonas sp. Nm51]
MARRAKRPLKNEINVVPYIDVMLVLLIIFMITAPMINPGQIELPEIGKSSAAPSAPLEVIIKADNSLALRDRAQTDLEKFVTHQQLIDAIKHKQKQNAKQPVVIAADKNVRYEEVINVMDILQRHQVQRVGLLAQPR